MLLIPHPPYLTVVYKEGPSNMNDSPRPSDFDKNDKNASIHHDSRQSTQELVIMINCDQSIITTLVSYGQS